MSPALNEAAKNNPMKTTLLLLTLAITAPLMAADASKILLTGASVSVEEGKAVGSAKAVVGEMTVAADAITFERAKNVLRCEGAVTIRVAGNVVTGRDCTIELGTGEKKLAYLSRGAISILPRDESRYFPTAPTDLIGPRSDREKLIRDFKARTEPVK